MHNNTNTTHVNFKDSVFQAVNNILQRHTRLGLSSRYVFSKILKSVTEAERIDSLEDLKTLKFVKDKSYEKIVQELNRIRHKSTMSSNTTAGNMHDDVMPSKSVTVDDVMNDDLMFDNRKNIHQDSITNNRTGPIMANNREYTPNQEITVNPITVHDTEEESDPYFRDICNKYNQKRDFNEFPEFYSDTQVHNDDTNAYSNLHNDSQPMFNQHNHNQQADSTNSSLVILTNHHTTNLNSDLERIFNSFSDLTLETNSSTLLSPIKNKKRKYVPGYRSAPYAILKALNHYNGSHKHLVVLKATPHTDTAFDRAQKFSAFTAFKLLQKKGLIQIDTDSKCYLTEEGKELCSVMFKNEEITPEEDQEVRLVIDSREKKSNRDRNFFQAHFSSKGIPNQTRYLTLGDFVWIKNERLAGVIVERKQTTDLVSSIFDGRFREQKNRMKMTGFTVFYIVEDLKVEEERRQYVNKSMLEARKEGFVLIETGSIHETANVLEKIDRLVRLVGVCDDVTNIDNNGIKDSMSYGSFLETSSKSNQSTKGILLVSLLGIRGLSKELAIGLTEKYGTILKFRDALKKDKNEVFESSFEGKRVGKRIGDRICVLFCVER